MRKPVLTIFYQYDPLNATIGGIQTIIGSFVKYAPDSLRLRLVGVTSTSELRPGVWHQISLKGREILFMPLFRIEDDNRRQWVPTTLRYTLALMKRHLASDFMHFHRLEPGLATFGWAGEKTLFVHNDILSQVIQDKEAQAKGAKLTTTQGETIQGKITQGKTKAKPEPRTILWRRFPQAYLALEALLIRKFPQILSCNSESKAFYQAHYPDIAERVSLVRNTVDTELFCPLSDEARRRSRRSLCERLKLTEDTRLLLFAGRLHPQKDPLLLLQSLAEVRRTSSQPVHLLVAGDGELMESMQAEIERLGIERLGIGPGVSLLGAQPQDQLIALHQCADLCVLTSRYEGLPLVVLEALACGVPVVTTRCGETPKLLSQTSGVVCDAREPEAIAAAIAQVLNHPDRYPQASCLEDAHPYEASHVIGEIYQQLLSRWEAQLLV